jgi:uncharacterized membrane protein YoaK (UPF0700 family)
VLAAYLATVGGFADSGGFILSGRFTSHVTGNVARLSTDLALRRPDAREAGCLVIAFLAGALAATLVIESRMFSRRPYAYGAALLLEAALLAGFLLGAPSEGFLHLRGLVLLCAAMGLQNSLVTRLSGAVVRTTHLTGVVTDLGIELGRWLRWLAGRPGAERPTTNSLLLYSVIGGTFTTGAIAGAIAIVSLGARAMLVPAAMVSLAALYAVASGRSVPVAGATSTHGA